MSLIGIALQTSLFAPWHLIWPLPYLQPDIVLLFVVWCSLKKKFTEGGIITLILADFAEIYSASPRGLFLITYMLVYLLIRGVSLIAVIPDLSSMVKTTIVASAVLQLACMGILTLLGAPANHWRQDLLFLIPGAVTNGCLGIWVYPFLEKFDEITYQKREREEVVWLS